MLGVTPSAAAAYYPAGCHDAAAGSRRKDEAIISNRFLHPCCGVCLLDPAIRRPPSTRFAETLTNPTTAPLLTETGSAAKWRRRKGRSLNDISLPTTSEQYERGQPGRLRAASHLTLPVAAMEEVHGVDVSWLHKPNKEKLSLKHLHAHSSPDVKKDVRDVSPSPAQNGATGKKPPPISTSANSDPSIPKTPSFPNVTPPTPVEPAKDTTHAYPNIPSQSKVPQASSDSKRPGLFNRPSSEKVQADPKGGKRSSWMNSFSSKFSTTPEKPAPTPIQPAKNSPLPSPAVNGTKSAPEAVEQSKPYVPSRPKESSSSFFSSLKRSLSSTSQTGIPQVQGTGGICERMVLNKDPNRERCDVPEMDTNKLRRVSFCVDVEIAGGPRYNDDDDEEDRKRRKKEFRKKEKSEGEALKNPEALTEEKDQEGEGDAETKSKAVPSTNGPATPKTEDGVNGSPTDVAEEDQDAAARKREKKKQSEAERKDRKEKRRRRAEESGSIPVELSLDGEGEDVNAGAPTSGAQPVANGAPNSASTPVQPQPNAHVRQDRPTTDPVRIYRRCCQLRESPILKRITEQLMNPKCILPQEPGVVNVLDLTGSRLQLADVVTLGDWLAVVPVKHLKLEDADLSDEGIRCILAGLLAAKRPEPTKRKSLTPKHREGITSKPHEERSGVVEKITLKNNPRMTRIGWKHISLFLYMCRSLRTIDLSMNQFPETLPPSAHVTPVKNPQNVPHTKGDDLDAGEALYKCLAFRLGGDKLEELIMSECGLTTSNVRKVVEGAIGSGVNRLGLAGNHLDDEGLDAVTQYLRSGICQALDVGGNDLRGKLGKIGEAMTVNINPDLICWGLCLADCNLDTASLKPLFAHLINLPSFRFIDLSHNRDLCSNDNSLITLLERYIRRFPDLKRIHLADVNMSPKQAISLANVLPEGPKLAHLNLLENPQLTALANATTESDQEDACALYASLMAAVRVSGTLICIDIDVPGQENSEVVKALAKQVVAYSLRNMEEFAIEEATGDGTSTANATAALTGPHGGEKGVKEVTVPDVLMHLVGHMEGSSENYDDEEPAPDEDYIVGGTGVVKALQYVLGEKGADDGRRTSAATGTTTPKERLGSTAGLPEPGKAMKTSKNLLGSARKIRERLQPALLKEAASGDEAAYRRLMFLDQTLQSIIERFEEEYPDTRLDPPPLRRSASTRSSLTDHSAQATSNHTGGTDDEDPASGGEEDTSIRPRSQRQNSDVNIASRAQNMEEGRLHRMGQAMRRQVIDSPAKPEFHDVPWRTTSHEDEDERFRRFGQEVENLSGVDLKKLVTEEGWKKAIEKVGGSFSDLRLLQEQDPEAWELFKEAQEKARLNLERTA